jgi:hypothetical protein
MNGGIVAFVLFILLTSVMASDGKSIAVRFTDNPPKIDGIIEDLWQQADSAFDFVQYTPYERTPPTEKTVVYVLQDEANIYFAFRCYTGNRKPVSSPLGAEDDITVKIDPFGSKTSGYYFWVFASDQIYDGWLFDDGRSSDDSWEGVWFRGVRLYEDRYEVEIKVPFKSIRYKNGLTEWGVQFKRSIPFTGEADFWTEVLQAEGDLISKWGTLTGVDPRVTGFHFELYPEAYLRYDRNFLSDSTDIKPSISMNLKWDVTSQTTLNGTLYPDFAHIESDPYTLNLDQYPVYLQERRPFFLEGADVFRMSDFGPGAGFFQPLNIFYSRRIGRSIDGDAVPIMGGLKLTNKSTDWNAGAMVVKTDDYMADDSVMEPDKWFGTLRAKRRVFNNSDIGMLFSGSLIDREQYSYAAGIDAVYRSSRNQLIAQVAVSEQSGKRGWAFSSGYFGDVGIFRTMASAEAVQDSFDVEDIGFVPWTGRQKLTLYTGPFMQYSKGVVRTLHIAGGVKAVREAGQDYWSKLGVLLVSPTFRNNMSVTLQLLAGPYYEADVDYLRKELLFSLAGNLLGYWLQINSSIGYMYNYYQDYVAYRNSTALAYNFAITPLINPGIRANMWIEWDTLNNVTSITPQLRPNITFFINGDTRIEVFSEMVFNAPGGDLGNSELCSNRFGFLFSWRFLPKSWLYIALNDYRAQDEYGSLERQYQIGAIKAKYLLYF